MTSIVAIFVWKYWFSNQPSQVWNGCFVLFLIAKSLTKMSRKGVFEVVLILCCSEPHFTILDSSFFPNWVDAFTILMVLCRSINLWRCFLQSNCRKAVLMHSWSSRLIISYLFCLVCLAVCFAVFAFFLERVSLYFA